MTSRVSTPAAARAVIERLSDRPADILEFLARTAERLPPSRIRRMRLLLRDQLPRWSRTPGQARKVAGIIQGLNTTEREKQALLRDAASVGDRFRRYLAESAAPAPRASPSGPPRTRGAKAAAAWDELPPRLRLTVLDELLSRLEAATAAGPPGAAPAAPRARQGAMTRVELVKRVAEKAQLSRAEAARVVGAIFDAEAGAIVDAIRDTGELTIPGFGRFTRRPRAARKGRNPRTGMEIVIRERDTVAFAPGRNLRDGPPAARAGAPGAEAARAPRAAPPHPAFAPAATPGADRETARPAEAGEPPDTPAETHRYTDVTLYREEIYPADLAAAVSVPDHVPMVGGEPYTLGVAIRRERTGIGAGRQAPRAVKNPRKERETVTVYVLARSAWAEVEIAEPLAKIEWPHDQDSGTALFRLRVNPPAGGDASRGYVELRLYDASLDLLDIVQVHDTVLRRVDGDAAPPPARQLSWPHRGEGAIEPGAASPPRLLSIHVSEAPGGFEFGFLFREPGGEELRIEVSRSIRPADLDALLRRVRDFWTKLVITNYARNLTVTASTFASHLNRLREFGQQAWLLLFGSRRADLRGASETLGQLLAGTAAEEGSRIQVTYAKSFNDFVFPWTILYPPGGEGDVDPLLFWGARYQIEQVTPGPRADALRDEPIDVLFALDPSFGNAEAQAELWKGYQTAAGGRLRVTDPISDRRAFFRELVRSPSAHVLYFFCHGYASAPPGGLRADGVQRMKTLIEAMEEASAERRALDTLLSLTARMGDESWIYIGDAEITESTLNLEEFFEARRPVVFLNMCQSAELLPSMSSGLVRVFLDHNASAVVGTESPMTAVFADAFARVVFDALFRGDDLGTALWKARRHFLAPERRNPLGLAYTLYGRAAASLGGGALIPGAETPDPRAPVP